MLSRQRDLLEQTVSQRTEALRKSEARITSVMESLPFDLFVLDAGGRYLLQNESCRRHWDGGSAPSLLDDLEPEMRREALAGETCQALLIREIDGAERHYHHIMAPITDRGKGIGALGVLIDVTERVEAEERRRQLEDRIQESQRLESLALMAGGVAHDFNNLLTAIIGSTDLARAVLDRTQPEVDTSLREIEQAATQAADLCRQMLAYSGSGQFVVGPVDLDQCLRGMEDLLASLSTRKTPVKLDLGGDLPAVEADHSQLQQVILNLVTNAAEASGEEAGPIRIDTGMATCDRAFLDRCMLGVELDEGRYVRLRVTDQGCGMDRETMAKVFEPFFSTKFVGRGLGLAAVLGIVRGHGGAIHLESESGVGSVVTVLLPAMDLPAADIAEAGAAERSVEWQGRGRILLVDDEAPVRKVGTALLGRLGFEVLTASDGQEAVDLVRRHGPELAGIILDLTMPKKGGETALSEIFEVDPGARVILTSGYNEADLTRRFDGAGLAGFLQKPFTMSSLREILRRSL
jgi:signal transduction histidine kinase